MEDKSSFRAAEGNLGLQRLGKAKCWL